MANENKEYTTAEKILYYQEQYTYYEDRITSLNKQIGYHTTVIAKLKYELDGFQAKMQRVQVRLALLSEEKQNEQDKTE